MKATWIRIAVLSILAVAVALFAFRYRHAQPENGLDSAAKLPVTQQLDASHQRLLALKTSMPMGLSNFGLGMRMGYFRSDNVLKDAFEASDGTLYVVYSHCTTEGAGCERYHFGFIHVDTLTEIWLPHDWKQWTYMELLPSTGDTAIVEATADDGGIRDYAVNLRRIVQIPRIKNAKALMPSTLLPQTLADGARCLVDLSSASPTLIWARSPHGTKTALVSKQEFLQSANGLEISDAKDARCSHFQNVNMLIVGMMHEDDVSFVLTPGRLWLAAPAAPELMTRNHMLALKVDSTSQGEVTGWEYINVEPKSRG